MSWLGYYGDEPPEPEFDVDLAAVGEARRWLEARGEDCAGAYPQEIVDAMDGDYPGGFDAFWTEYAAEKAARSLGQFDYADVIRKARAA